MEQEYGVPFEITAFCQVRRNQISGLKASSCSLGLAQELTSYEVENMGKTDGGQDLFAEMKQRFHSFKKQRYLEDLEHFQALAEAQYPKFMVIACADSRVCPSNILGFQPGEAFMIRNVANLVPPLEHGPSETNAALEFAVNTLEVENILVIGHSSCGGIQALMSMQDDVDSRSFLEKWVINGKSAKLKAKAEAAHSSFDQQCGHCEKESINRSLLNLLTYPWIQERVRKELLSIHGGYYDFLNCSFEKWTLDLKGSSIEGGRYSFKDQAFWN
nr:beta carbonic anhydrase 5, chloroplastic-like isoform X4 [Quercus suber]